MVLGALFILSSSLWAQNSATGRIPTYLELCQKAARDQEYFQIFRSHPDYAPILEIGQVREFANYLLKNASADTLSKWKDFEKLEAYGNPVRHAIDGIGRFSGTTLRYITIADQIHKFFNLPTDAKIVEIGAGFGGQCYILSQLLSFSKYYIYDLPEVESLIERMMQTLSVKNTYCLDPDSELPDETIDLVISNYAFSECDEPTQLDYFERVLKKADRGYLIVNKSHDFSSPEKILTLLKQSNKNPKTYNEPVFTYPDNQLIIWDKTQPQL